MLTHGCIATLWLVFPVYSQEIYWDTRHHDDQSNNADHRLRVEGEDQQESPEQQVDHRPDQVHLQGGESAFQKSEILNQHKSVRWLKGPTINPFSLLFFNLGLQFSTVA